MKPTKLDKIRIKISLNLIEKTIMNLMKRLPANAFDQFENLHDAKLKLLEYLKGSPRKLYNRDEVI